ISNRAIVNAVTKADIFGQVVKSNDVVLKVAALALVDSPEMANEPDELKEMIRRMDMSRHALKTPKPLTEAEVAAVCEMSASDALLFGLSAGDPQSLVELKFRRDAYVAGWLSETCAA